MVSILTANALLNTVRVVPTSGIVATANLVLYNDPVRTIECQTINWGTMAPNETRTHALYIYNNGTIPLQLGLRNSNWNPLNANTYISVTWDRETTVIEPGATISAILSLHVDMNITGITTFRCDLVIQGTQEGVP